MQSNNSSPTDREIPAIFNAIGALGRASYGRAPSGPYGAGKQ